MIEQPMFAETVIAKIIRGSTCVNSPVIEEALLERDEMTCRKFLDELSSDLRHSINNPLTVIMGKAELLLMNPALPDKIRHDLEIMVEAAEKIADHVKEL